MTLINYSNSYTKLNQYTYSFAHSASSSGSDMVMISQTKKQGSSSASYSSGSYGTKNNTNNQKYVSGSSYSSGAYNKKDTNGSNNTSESNNQNDTNGSNNVSGSNNQNDTNGSNNVSGSNNQNDTNGSNNVSGSNNQNDTNGSNNVSGANNQYDVDNMSGVGSGNQYGVNNISGASGVTEADPDIIKAIDGIIQDFENGVYSISDANVRISHLNIKTNLFNTDTDQYKKTVLSFVYNNKEYSITSKSYNATIKSSETKNEKALKAAIQALNLEDTQCKGVYRERTGSSKKHYVWDDENQVMKLLSGVYIIDSKGNSAKNTENYELVQYWQNIDQNGYQNQTFIARLRAQIKKEGLYSEEYLDMIFEYINSKPELLNGPAEMIQDTINKITSEVSLRGGIFKTSTSLNQAKNIYSNNYTILGVQNDFFAYMVSHITDFKSNDERDLLFKKALLVATEAAGEEAEWSGDAMNWITYHYDCPNVDASKFIKLDKNGNGSWIEEFFEILNGLADVMQNNKKDSKVKTINIDSLFGDKEVLTAQDISEMYEDMYFTSDPSVSNLRNLIGKAFEKYNIDNYYDEVEMLKYVIQLLNEKAGVENTKPISLSKNAIEKLNENNIFKIINDIVNSDELQELYYFDVDDEIDNYAEGRIAGDCWMIGALYSLNQSETGKQIIKDAVTVNKDGSVTITFKGVNKSYTITKDELKYAKQHSTGYSFGDNTMLAIAVATERLRVDLGKTYTPSAEIKGKAGEGIYSGHQFEMLKWITGKNSSTLSSDFDTYSTCLNSDEKARLDYLKQSDYDEYLNIRNEFSKKYNFYSYLPGIMNGDVIVNLTSHKVEGGIEFTTVDGKTLTFCTGNHAFGVKSVNSETITIFDLYTPNEYTFYIEDFLNGSSHMNFGYTVIGDFKPSMVNPEDVSIDIL